MTNHLLFPLLLLFACASCKLAEDPQCTPYNQETCNEEEPTHDDDSTDQPQLKHAYLKACESAIAMPCDCYYSEEICALDFLNCDAVCEGGCEDRIEPVDACQQAVYGPMSEKWDSLFEAMVDCIKAVECFDYFNDNFEERIVQCGQIQLAQADADFVDQVYDRLSEVGCDASRWPSLTGFWAPMNSRNPSSMKEGR